MISNLFFKKIKVENPSELFSIYPLNLLILGFDESFIYCKSQYLDYKRYRFLPLVQNNITFAGLQHRVHVKRFARVFIIKLLVTHYTQPQVGNFTQFLVNPTRRAKRIPLVVCMSLNCLTFASTDYSDRYANHWDLKFDIRTRAHAKIRPF